MPDGIPKKNGSTQWRRVVSSQLPIQTIAVRTRRPWTASWRCRRRRRRSGTGSPVAAAAAGRSVAGSPTALIAHQHLVSEAVPDLLVDLGEPRLEADPGPVAGAGRGPGEEALSGPR